MTDLPTRLRTGADLHDTLTAGLMRDAADEIERLREVLAPFAEAEHPAETMAGQRIDRGARPIEDHEDVSILVPLGAIRSAQSIFSPASSPIVKTEDPS